jgi:hypothetical protein
MRLLLLFIPAILMSGCGGSGTVATGDLGPSAEFRAKVEADTQFALRSIQTRGEIDLGLDFVPELDLGNYQEPRFNNRLQLWATVTTGADSPEPLDGVSHTYRVISTAMYYPDATKTESAGSREYIFYQDEFSGNETTTVREMITAGPYAGYAYSKDLSVSLSTMEQTGDILAQHPNWGELRSIVHSWGGFTLVRRVGGKTDRFVREDESSEMLVTLSDGTTVKLTEGDETTTQGVGVGTVMDGSGKEVASIEWKSGEFTVRWVSGGERTLSIW